jgi:DNA-binding NarL/FixJ family response regulator
VALLANTSASIRVLAAVADPVSCELLWGALAFDSNLSVVTVNTPEQALQIAEPNQFEVALISTSLLSDPMEALSLVRELHRLHPDLGLVVLQESMERRLVVEAFRSGALGIFCTLRSIPSLSKCIHCVHAGQVWASSAELEFVLEAVIKPASVEGHFSPPSRRLSRREEEISRLVAEGFSNRQISDRLKLSEHTVKNYLFRVFEKLGVSTRVELTLHALGCGKARPISSDVPEPAMHSKERFLGSEMQNPELGIE